MTIRFTAAACLLAQAIYFGRAEAFLLDVPHWDALDPGTRALYIDQAADILKANRPADVLGASSPLFDAMAGITRRHASKVVGAISPSEPYGVSR